MLRIEEFSEWDLATTDKLVLRPAENAVQLDEDGAVLQELKEIVGNVNLIAVSENKINPRRENDQTVRHFYFLT